MRVKDAAASAAKFKNNAGAAQGSYAAGVRAAGNEWAANTAAAEDNYIAGVNEAASQKRFSRGVAKAGAQHYVDRAANVGAGRFQQGVMAAENSYAQGVQPYLDVIRNTSLPPRGPKGSPSNMLRVQAIAEALRAKKIGSAA